MSRTSFLTQCLFALMLCCIGFAAQAQSIRFYNAQGREIRTGNPFPYDRFSRGETCYIEVADSNGYGWFDYWITSARGTERGLRTYQYYLWNPFVVPTNPNADNVIVHVFDYWTWREVTKRIPIGTK